MNALNLTGMVVASVLTGVNITLVTLSILSRRASQRMLSESLQLWDEQQAWYQRTFGLSRDSGAETLDT